jgi:hypothetical protein
MHAHLEEVLPFLRQLPERIATSVAEARARGLRLEQQPRTPLSTDIVNKMNDRAERRQARDLVMPSGHVESAEAWADLDLAT